VNLTVVLAPYDLTVIDIIAYAGLAAAGAMRFGLLPGMAMAVKYDPVVSWPHRRLALFKVHDMLAYAALALILLHPALLLLADGKGFGAREILVPVFAPIQPFENTPGRSRSMARS
jgi:hypothetical protein